MSIVQIISMIGDYNYQSSRDYPTRKTVFAPIILSIQTEIFLELLLIANPPVDYS